MDLLDELLLRLDDAGAVTEGRSRTRGVGNRLVTNPLLAGELVGGDVRHADGHPRIDNQEFEVALTEVQVNVREAQREHVPVGLRVHDQLRGSRTVLLPEHRSGGRLPDHPTSKRGHASSPSWCWRGRSGPRQGVWIRGCGWPPPAGLPTRGPGPTSTRCTPGRTSGDPGGGRLPW